MSAKQILGQRMKQTLPQLVSKQRVEDFLESFLNLTGAPVGVYDARGFWFASSSQGSICSRFHLSHPEMKQQCMQCDKDILARFEENQGVSEEDQVVSITCDCHMQRAAYPIKVKDALLGYISISQYLSSAPDESLFVEQAGTLGVNLDEYMRALHETPIIPTSRIHALMGVCASFTNALTELGAAQMQRSTAERSHLNLFESMGQGVVYQNAAGEITSANPAAEKILGLTLEQMQGRTSLDPRWRCIKEDGDDYHGAEHPAMRALQQGAVIADELMGVYNPATGTYRWLQVNSVPEFTKGAKEPFQVFSTFTDISERKRVEELLRASKCMLEEEVQQRTRQLEETNQQLQREIQEREAIFSNSQVGIMLLRGGRVLVQGNQRLADIFGYESPEKMHGVSMRQLHLSEERFHEFGERYYYSLRTQDQLHIEYELRRKDGTPIWCSVSGKAIDSGVPPDLDKGVIWIVDDISDRKAAELALRESENRFRTLVEHSSDAIILHDLEGRIFDANRCALDNLGYTRDELLALRLHDIDLNYDEKEVSDICQHLDQEIGSLEGEHRRKDGATFPVEIRFRCMEYMNRSLFLSTARDISDRYKTQRELQMLRRAVEHSPVSIVITTTEGEIEYVNPVFSLITGYAREEVLGHNPRIFKSNVHSPEFYANMWKTLLDGNDWRGEVCNRKKNGDTYWENVSISPVKNRKGETTHYIAVKEDISKRKELDELRQNIDNIMRHDLKGPLNGIIGVPEIILADEDISEENRTLLELLRDTGQSMLGIINETLTLFKIETGRYQCAIQPMDLAQVLYRIGKELSRTVEAAGVALNFHGLPPQEDGVVSYTLPTHTSPETFIVHGEQSLSYSMFSNLITNAVEASPPGGEISVRISRRDENGENVVAVSVTNAGAIPVEIRNRFGEKYTTAGKENGTGLGVYSARMMAELQGGGFHWRTSDEEQRTTVTITLAACEP